jgi:uncharacterized cupredoxin-like copper-binding protein
MSKLTIALLSTTLLAAACSSSQHATGNTTFTRTEKGVNVQVLLDEYKIHMPTTIPPGNVTFNVKNTGSHRHTIEISGQGVDARLSPDLEAGQSGDLRVTLAPGKYKVWCPVGPHESLGMRLELTVQNQ